MFWNPPDSNENSRTSVKIETPLHVNRNSTRPSTGPIIKFGEIEFSGRSQAAKFAVISKDCDEATLRDLISMKWNLKPPTMLISVFGTDFEMVQKLRKIFKRGLWKAAENAGCWIITDGLSRGITRLTGDAIRDYTDAYGGHRMLGFGVCCRSRISQFEVIENSPIMNQQPVLYKSIESSSTNKVMLDSNYSYLVIIDDSSDEAQPSYDTHQLPKPQRDSSSSTTSISEESETVRVVVERVMSMWQTPIDNSTNHIVHEPYITKPRESRSSSDEHLRQMSSQFEMRKKSNKSSMRDPKKDKIHADQNIQIYRVPICGLLVGGDFVTLSEVYASVKQNKCPVVIIKGTSGVADLLAAIIITISDSSTISQTESEDDVLNTRINTLLNEFFPDEIPKLDAAQLTIYKNMIKNIVSNQTLFSIFDVSEDWDLDGYMISALLSSANPSAKNELNLEQLDITLRLNRADIARDKIFLEGKQWKKDALNNFMYRALMTDKHEFVRLFLDQGFSLDDFMTVHILEKLYTDQLNKMNSKIALFRQLWAPHRSTKVNLRDIGKMIRLLIGEFYQPLYLSKRFLIKLVPQNKDEKKSETLGALLQSSDLVVSSGVLLAGKKPKKESSTATSSEDKVFQTVTNNYQNHQSQQEHQKNQEQQQEQQPQQIITTTPNGGNEFPNLQHRRQSSLEFILHPKLRQKMLTFNRPGFSFFNKTDSTSQEKDESWNDEADETMKKRIKLERPARELMIWSLLVGKLSMTELFWTLEKEPIAAALLTSMLMTSLSRRTDDFTDKEDFQEEAKHFESLAEGVLNQCYREDERRAQLLINRELDFYGQSSVIRLAAQGRCIKFMAHPCCQDFLTSTWMGRISNKNSSRKIAAALFLGISIPILIPKVIYYKYQEKEYNNISTDREQPSPLRQNTLRRWSQSYQITRQNSQAQSEDLESNPETKQQPSYKTTYGYQILRETITMTIDFYVAPVTRFAYNMIFYAGFLCLYSYIMLENFNVQFGALDYFLIFWIITLFIEEIKQIIKEGTFRTYISDGWNKLDCVAITLFLVGLIFRLIVLFNVGDGVNTISRERGQFYMMTDDNFVAARILYSFSLFVFYVRLMYIFSFHIALGPKLVMIGKMVYNDLIPFMIILGVILIGYAITAHGISFPNGYYAVNNQSLLTIGDANLEVKTDMAQNFINIYYQMYGEFGLENMRGENDKCTKDNKCPHWTSKVLVPIMMGVFVLMTNILLFNLLIAMFSRTYEEIESSSTYYWNFQRYEMIAEYIDRSPLAPPFIILWYGYMIVLWVRRKIFIVKQEIYTKPEDPFCKNYCDENPTKNRELIKWEHLKAADYMRNINEPTFHHNGGVVARQRPGVSAVSHLKSAISILPSPVQVGMMSGRMKSGSVDSNADFGSNNADNNMMQLFEFQMDKMTKDISNHMVQILEPCFNKITELHNGLVIQTAETKELVQRMDNLEAIINNTIKITPQSTETPTAPQIEVLLNQMEGRLMEKVSTSPSVSEKKKETANARCQTKVPTREMQTSIRPKTADKATKMSTIRTAHKSIQISSDQISKPIEARQPPLSENISVQTTSPATASLQHSQQKDQEEFFTAYKAKMLDIDDAQSLTEMIEIVPRRLQAADPMLPDSFCDPCEVPDLSRMLASYLVRGYVTQREVLDHRLWRICPVNFEIYPGVRANVPTHNQSWAVSYPTYAPFQISDERLLYPNEDSYDPSEFSLNMMFNSYDSTYRLWRMSLGDRYPIDRQTGLPLNPKGRTGLQSRGFLPRWGPNHATFLLLTRISKSATIEPAGGAAKQIDLEFGAIKSGETFFIPFYFTDHLESCYLEDCVVNLMLALLYRRVRNQYNEARTNELIDPILCASISVISEAYINDTLNADNAWIEGTLVNFHESDEYPFEDELLKCLIEDPIKEDWRWTKVSHISQIRQSHKNLLRKLAISRQASY